MTSSGKASVIFYMNSLSKGRINPGRDIDNMSKV